jgi:hypothetical protein
MTIGTSFANSKSLLFSLHLLLYAYRCVYQIHFSPQIHFTATQKVSPTFSTPLNRYACGPTNLFPYCRRIAGMGINAPKSTGNQKQTHRF